MSLKIDKTPLALAALAGRIVLGAIFIYASWDKLIDPAAFAQAIANYQILPMAWVNAAALFLPWLELTCGLGLLTGLAVRGSALVAGGLIVVFIGALAHSIIRGIDIHCGCFSAGEGGTSNLYLDILRDIVLLAVAIVVLIRYGRPNRLNPQGR